MSSSCLCHRESIIQALLYSFIFYRLTTGGLMGFSAVSMDSSFEADEDTDSAGAGRKHTHTHTYTHTQNTTVAMFCCAISLQFIYRMKVKRGKAYIKADLFKQKWNGPVSCFWTFEERGVWVAGNESLYLYFASSMWRLWRVTVNVCFACWSTNSGSDFV